MRGPPRKRSRLIPVMHFVLVHGWGFNAGIWRDLRVELPGNAQISQVDLGFVGGPEGMSDWPQDAIAIGHSLGVLWLLHQAQSKKRLDFNALVSIQGFDRFCPHVPPSRVERMRRELARDPAATLAAFWRACGTVPFATPDSLDVERLDEGLGWLLEWDATAAKAGLGCPVLALAARDDEIVPAKMSAAIWGEDNIRWSETGGHVLPLTRPEWCVFHVLDFAHDLEA